MRAGVDLSDRGHDALEKRPVVGDDDESAAAAVQEVLQPFEAVEVEVVGGLVQEHDVEPGQQERRESHPRRLTAGKLRHAESQQRRRESEVGTDGPSPCLEIRAAEGEVPFECGPVPGVGSRLGVGQRARRPVKSGFCLGNSCAPREVLGKRLSLDGFAFLCQVAHGRGRGQERHATLVGLVEAREDPQQRGLADAIGPENAQSRPGADRKAHRFQDRLHTLVLGHTSGDQRRRASCRCACGGPCDGVAGVAGVRHVGSPS